MSPRQVGRRRQFPAQRRQNRPEEPHQPAEGATEQPGDVLGPQFVSAIEVGLQLRRVDRA